VSLKANNNITILKLNTKFSTQCSNWCQCVLGNFQWFLSSIMSVTVLNLGGGGTFFGTQCRGYRHNMEKLEPANLLDVTKCSNNWHSCCRGNFMLDRVEHILIKQKSNKMEGAKTGCTAKSQISQYQRTATRPSPNYFINLSMQLSVLNYARVTCRQQSSGKSRCAQNITTAPQLKP